MPPIDREPTSSESPARYHNETPAQDFGIPTKKHRNVSIAVNVLVAAFGSCFVLCRFHHLAYMPVLALVNLFVRRRLLVTSPDMRHLCAIMCVRHADMHGIWFTRACDLDTHDAP